MHKNVLVAAAIMAGAHGASAATIDFTDRSVWSSAAGSTQVAGAQVTLSSTRGTINFNEDFDRSRTPACQGFGGSLVCDSDGLGVNNDELTTTPNVAQTVTLNFSAPVRLIGASFLDLYIALDSSDFESAQVFFDNDLGTLLTFDAVEVFDGSTAGFASVMFKPTTVSSVTFRASGGNDQIGQADFALAAVEVAPVPLPAAAWMLLAGVGALASVARRTKA